MLVYFPYFGVYSGKPPGRAVAQAFITVTLLACPCNGKVAVAQRFSRAVDRLIIHLFAVKVDVCPTFPDQPHYRPRPRPPAIPQTLPAPSRSLTGSRSS